MSDFPFESVGSTRHTSMPGRVQKTPFGDVSLASRWQRDRYYLMAYGPEAALHWMFPSHQGTFESIGPGASRHSFAPAPETITVERILRRVCAQWQEAWNERLADFTDRPVNGIQSSGGDLIRSLGHAIDRYQVLRADELAPGTRERNRHYLARWTAVHASLVAIVRPFRRAQGWVLHAAKAMPKRGGTKRVYRYDPKKIWLRVLNKAIARGAKAITPHGMRHAFASNLLMAGVSDVLVARWLGHADTSMVHQHYGHLLSYHGDINRVKFGFISARPERQ